MDCFPAVSVHNRFSPLAAGTPIPAMQQIPSPRFVVPPHMQNVLLHNSVDIFANMSSEEKLSQILVKVSNIESSNQTLAREMGNISASVRYIQQRVDTIDTCVDVHSRMLKLLAYKSIDSEARSRRNNLIFRGIGEDSKESEYIL